jgi:hypothetical protein
VQDRRAQKTFSFITSYDDALRLLYLITDLNEAAQLSCWNSRFKIVKVDTSFIDFPKEPRALLLGDQNE